MRAASTTDELPVGVVSELTADLVELGTTSQKPISMRVSVTAVMGVNLISIMASRSPNQFLAPIIVQVVVSPLAVPVVARMAPFSCTFAAKDATAAPPPLATVQRFVVSS